MNNNETATVYFPFAGNYYLFHWYTYDNRGHIILAKNEKSLYLIAEKIIDNYAGIQIKDFLKIELVGPSEKLVKLIENKIYEENVQLFLREVRAELYCIEDTQLPKQFMVCDNYSETEEKKLEDDPNHYICDNCFEGIKLKDLTPEEFYHKYKNRWLEVHSDNCNEPKDEEEFLLSFKAEQSKASPARDDEEIYKVIDDFGPHASGLCLEVLKYDDIRTNPVLFYFRKLEELNKNTLEEIKDKYRKITEMKTKKEDEEFNKRGIERHRRIIEKVLKVFSE